jgi:hypothetical protein
MVHRSLLDPGVKTSAQGRIRGHAPTRVYYIVVTDSAAHGRVLWKHAEGRLPTQ